MQSRRVAIFMPAYEPKEAHIRAAVESVLAQTNNDWTLLINDDASVREPTENHIRSYLSDPRITFRRNPKNLGIGGNWNVCWRQPSRLPTPQTIADSSPKMASPPLPGGIGRGGEGVRGVRQLDERPRSQFEEHSSMNSASPPLPAGVVAGGRGGKGGEAEYIAFLFHDDLWEPQYLEKMIASLDANPSAGFAAANHTYIQEGEIRTAPLYDELRAFMKQNITSGLHEHRQFLRWWMARGLKPNVIGEPSFVILRRSLMEQVGPFNESMVQFLDSEYWARCLLKADWVYVPEELGKFRLHPAGMSAVNEGLGRGVFERFQTLQIVVAGLPPEEKKAGNAVIVKALSGMIGQYMARRKEGKSIHGKGSGGLKSFVLRHPILTLRAVIGWILQKKQ